MNTKTLAGITIDVNDEGFLMDADVWNPALALAIAQEEGIAELTPAHWQVIDFCRHHATANGAAPTLKAIMDGAGITTKELFALFPKGPAKKVAKISGLGKPEGCV
ncbi:MAG TPA: TusE/DsrC/DsvC family sulfur relay protein [Anaerolineales bacterium]|nr:TusE/DsrC/DsvC family sulfur relay protein [Anaerolineales bacterium]